jgi:phosphate starvation-inducible PhoH-like protein
MGFAQTVDIENEFLPEFLTRNQKKKLKKQVRQHKQPNKAQPQQNIMQLPKINPLTSGQARTFQAFDDGKNLILHGVAGTGKTFMSVYLALRAVLDGDAPKPVVIIRSVVPTRDMGFLPGTQKEKSAVYEEPYSAICNELFKKPGAYDTLKRDGTIQFATTSFLRGLTFRDNIVIVDECQNMTFHELDSVITRMGTGCRVIFCGDFRQSDLWRNDEREGLHTFMSVIKHMRSFARVEFTKDDIVRSDLVREYIEAKLEEGLV